MNQEKLQRLAKLFEISNSEITREEFNAAFRKVVSQIVALEKKVLENVNYKEQEEKAKIERLVNELKGTVEMIKSDLGKFVATATGTTKSHHDAMEKKFKEIDIKLASLKDGDKGDAGKDADNDYITDQLLKKIVVPQVDYARLEEIKKELAELKSRGRIGGGGFSKIAMEGKFVDDETPSGTVNGTNKVFTIANIPNPPTSVKVYVGGVRMRVTEDYTLSGKTITFVSAPETNSKILVDYRV